MNEEVKDLESSNINYIPENQVYDQIISLLNTAPVLDRERLNRRLQYYLDCNTPKRF